MNEKEGTELLISFLREETGYAVVRNVDIRASLARGGDVDLVVLDTRRFVQALLRKLGPPILWIKRSYNISFFWIWGHVDIIPSVDWHGAVYLEREQVIRSAFQNADGLWEADLPHQALICWFPSLLWGGFFKRRYGKVITSAAQQHESELFYLLAGAVGTVMAKRLLYVARREIPEISENWVSSIRQNLWLRGFARSPLRTLKGMLNFWVSEIKLRIDPPTPVVGILGLGEIQKPNFLHTLKDELGSGHPFMDVLIEEWTRLPRGGSSKFKLFGDCKVNRRWACSLAFLVRLVLSVGHWLLLYGCKGRHVRAKGILLIVYGQLANAFVNANFYRYGKIGAYIVRFMAKIIPKPKLFIFVDVPVSRFYSQNDARLATEIEKVRKAWIGYICSSRDGYVVDGNRPLKDVVADVKSVIVKYMMGRTREELRNRGMLD